MAFDDRWSYEFRLGWCVPLLLIALGFGALVTGLQLWHHYIGLPSWFIDMWVPR